MAKLDTETPGIQFNTALFHLPLFEVGGWGQENNL